MIAEALPNTRIDRRLDERRDCLAGLTRWLESARRTLQVDALAVADASGCLVIGAGSARDCEELAALAPLAGTFGGDSGVSVSPLSAGAAWLCAPSKTLPSDEWHDTARGCLRILGLH